MRALVVYESMFGNTASIAAAVAAGLEAAGAEVATVEVGQAPQAPGPEVDLLVVGAPTHAFGLSRPETRRSAADQASAPLVSGGRGVREWLAALPAGTGRAVAAFDTHIDRRFPGTASKAVLRRLQRIGYEPVAPARTFHVSATTGPLVDGELDRARGWGRELGADVRAASC